MKKVTVRIPEENIEVEVSVGTLLLDAVAAAGFRISSECGGAGRCGKCRIFAGGDVSEPSVLERKHLSDDELSSGVRLACAAVARGDVEIRFDGPAVSDRIFDFPPVYEMAEDEIHDASLKRKNIRLSHPGGDDRRSDLRRVTDTLDVAGVDIPVAVLRELPRILREKSFDVDVFSDGGKVTDIAPAGLRRLTGVAVDIGTTTICARLADIETGAVLESAMTYNPQRLYGADVASRITYAGNSSGGTATLRRLVVKSINDVTADLALRAGVSMEDILKFTVAGNSTMVHLFLGVDPGAIAVAPYISPTTGPMRYGASELELEAAPGAVVHILPAVAAYVGADAVAAALRVRLHRSERPAAVIDLGTNAEIILTDGHNFYACSAAAGPALEGAHIKHGMTAAPGAVCRVDMDDEIRVETIGGAPPAGLCGTGLLDSVAEALKAGMISGNGRIVDPEKESKNGFTAGRITEGGDGREIIIYRPPSDGEGRKISLSQKDIRQFQLARGAIRAGLDILLEKTGIDASELEAIHLAGALGTAIRAESALAAGLVPDVPENVICSAGNAALDGATEALLSDSFADSAVDFSGSVNYIELSAIKEFTDAFVQRLEF
ncbi:ASKHA domain-containing protein [bacterium]